jgi:hypothetical protein
MRKHLDCLLKKERSCDLPQYMASRAILKIPSNDQIGDSIRAPAALVLNDDCEGAFEMEEMLWEMAARAGFMPPADIAKKLRRRGILVASNRRGVKLVRARAQLVEAVS